VKDGRDPVVFQGLNPSGPEAVDRVHVPRAHDRPRDAQPARPRPGSGAAWNLNQNAIYLECFIDEIAHATKQDPLALRRKLMAKHPKHLAVLNAAAERAGWGKPLPAGVHRGIAQTHGFGSYVAAVAEVSVSKDGVAEDPSYRPRRPTRGTPSIRSRSRAQVEGSFAYGLSAALFGACTVKDGRIEQTNFHDYPVVRMEHMPKVETVIVPSGASGWRGEPTIAVAAPAVLNAIFAATGKRIRDLPLAKHSLKA